MPRTKMQILEERLAEKQRAADELERQIQGLHRTPCQLKCAKCGKYLKTEADFAAHFIVTDERYLNLGECPVKLGLPIPD